MIIVLIIALIILSGVSKAMMDTLQFHFEQSVFKNKGNWWNPQLSWKNKYEWFKGNKVLTWLISNPFVAITDAWHFFQFVHAVSFALVFILITYKYPIWVNLVGYISSRFVFHMFYTYILKKK